MHCKSLWIKASAKCINVNVNVYKDTCRDMHFDIVSRVCVISDTNRRGDERNWLFTCICVALTVSTLDEAAWRDKIITHNQWCCLQRMRRAWQIPDIKLMPRSIYDLLTQSSHDLQRLLCHVQCKQPLAVAARHDTRACRENDQYQYNINKHRTSCDVTIVDAHIAISMLKRCIMQPYLNLSTNCFLMCQHV